MTRTTTQDTTATDLARATLASGRPWAARRPDGMFNSTLRGTSAAFEDAR